MCQLSDLNVPGKPFFILKTDVDFTTVERRITVKIGV